MKMSILKLEYSNIRKIPSLTISFENDDKIIKNSFIMMGNGTGKTTTLTLIKGLLDGTAAKWTSDVVKSFKPINKDVQTGYFKLHVMFDDRLYVYILTMDYNLGKALIETSSSITGGKDEGLRLPESLRSIFSPDFVRRFVFDGEQAQKALDSSSDEAERAIKYLYRLDELDDILSSNQTIYNEIQAAQGRSGSQAAISTLKSYKNKYDTIVNKLRARAQLLKDKLKTDKEKLDDLTKKRSELDQNCELLNEEKHQIIAEKTENRGKLDSKIVEIVSMIKSPYLLSQSISNRMNELGSSMRKLKLPKTISKDFFTELAHAPECVCGRCIGEEEQQAILANAEKYLGSDQQAVLNVIKNRLMDASFDTQLDDAFKELEKLREEANNLETRFQANEEKLLAAGGDQAAALQQQIDELKQSIAVNRAELTKIESKDTSDDQLTAENNINKAQTVLEEYEGKIAAATRTSVALKKKKNIEELVNAIKKESMIALKKEIIRKTNTKLRNVITDDLIEIEEIDRYIKLKQKSTGSEGQTLIIAYCFLGTLFEDAELEFPFIIDSPAGSMDLEKREAVAGILPQVFNQMISFVTSAEVEKFADQFYSNNDSQFITIVANPDSESVSVYNGKDFFDSYQREHRED